MWKFLVCIDNTPTIGENETTIDGLFELDADFKSTLFYSNTDGAVKRLSKAIEKSINGFPLYKITPYLTARIVTFDFAMDHLSDIKSNSQFNLLELWPEVPRGRTKFDCPNAVTWLRSCEALLFCAHDPASDDDNNEPYVTNRIEDVLIAINHPNFNKGNNEMVIFNTAVGLQNAFAAMVRWSKINCAKDIEDDVSLDPVKVIFNDLLNDLQIHRNTQDLSNTALSRTNPLFDFYN